jgi:hypothetical protein
MSLQPLIDAVNELQQEVTTLTEAVDFRKSELDAAVLTTSQAAEAAVEAALIANQEKRHDWVSPYSYLGKAPDGSNESSDVWTISRIEVEVDGTTTVTTATNVAWTNRTTIIYS